MDLNSRPILKSSISVKYMSREFLILSASQFLDTSDKAS
jgi:hypothetical protein